MNEWQLQDQLTKDWIQHPLVLDSVTYFLVAWELMFPSWKMNYNKKKWNEPSIDFILFDGQSTFLCLELKNEIKGKKALLSAYCQVQHWANLFAKQYSSVRMTHVHENCFEAANSYRIIDLQHANHQFVFPIETKVIPVIGAKKFPEDAAELISGWQSNSQDSIRKEIAQYTLNKELSRFAEIEYSRIPVKLLHV